MSSPDGEGGSKNVLERGEGGEEGGEQPLRKKEEKKEAGLLPRAGHLHSSLGRFGIREKKKRRNEVFLKEKSVLHRIKRKVG